VLSISGNLTASPAVAAGPMSTFSAGDVLIIVHVETEQPMG